MRAATVKTKPLRILQVNSLMNGGGTDNQTLELTAGLRDAGADVRLAISAGSRWEPKARALNVPVATFVGRSPLKLRMIGRLASIIRKMNIALVHAHQGRDYWPSIMAAKLAANGARVVVSRHLMTRPRSFSRPFLLRMADVVAVSRSVERVQREQLAGPKSHLHQIYGGVDTKLFQPARTPTSFDLRKQFNSTSDCVVFGVVGAFDLPRGKGQAEFLSAAAQLRTDFPQARFAIIGAGSMESLLRETIANEQLENVARIIPFTNDIAPMINALDVLVHPAVGTEALGLVIWEAMASGKPIIASNLHGISEAFVEGEHGKLVEPGNVTELYNAMRELLLDDKLRKQRGEAAREYVVRNFSRDAMAVRTLELYNQIMDRLHAPQ